MKGIKTFVVSLAIFGSGTIVLGFLAGYPIIGIGLALFIVLFMYLLSVASQLAGAENALRNPPPPGETRVTLKVFDREMPFSEKFIFSPPAPDGRSSTFVIDVFKNKGGRPQGSLKGGLNINSPDVMQWHREAKRIWQEESYEAFVNFCKDAGEDEATVRSRIQKYLT